MSTALTDVSILLVDDHLVYLNGLADTIRRFPYVKDVHRCSSVSDAILYINDHNPNLVFLDYQLKEMDGPKGLKLIRQHSPGLPVITISHSDEPQRVHSMIDAGVNGYLSKDVLGKEISLAITTVLSGRYYFSRNIAESLTMYRAGQVSADIFPEPPAGHLTERHLQIIRYFTMGKSTAEMAELMFLSPGTIETYRKEVLHKTNSKNILDIARFAINNGIVSVEEFLNGKLKEGRKLKGKS